MRKKKPLLQFGNSHFEINYPLMKRSHLTLEEIKTELSSANYLILCKESGVKGAMTSGRKSNMIKILPSSSSFQWGHIATSTLLYTLQSLCYFIRCTLYMVYMIKGALTLGSFDPQSPFCLTDMSSPYHLQAQRTSLALARLKEVYFGMSTGTATLTACKLPVTLT